MIDIKNLHYSYGDKKVINGIDLHIAKAEVFGLLGPNGAGKTTLISILTGLLREYAGSVVIDGMDLRTKRRHVQKVTSFIPQSLAFYKNLTAFENLEFFGGLYGLRGKTLHKRIAYVTEVTNLGTVVRERAHTLSGGLKRRLNIAIGLLNTPRIMYLDEPTVGIDPQSRNQLLHMIKDLNSTEKMTVVYLDEVAYLCDRIAIIDRGSLVKSAAKNSSESFDQGLEELYLQTVGYG
jgi:ABC-2 type transport system ATP-binding protein